MTIFDHHLANLLKAVSTLPPESRLHVMAQNPSDAHHWSKPVGDEMSALEFHAALKCAIDGIGLARTILDRHGFK